MPLLPLDIPQRIKRRVALLVDAFTPRRRPAARVSGDLTEGETRFILRCLRERLERLEQRVAELEARR